MYIDEVVDAVRGYRGVLRKAPVAQLAEALLSVRSDDVIAAPGEDAAVIGHGDEVLLLAADGILEDLVAKDPAWAGYCSVLVNVNDIAAMGGRPIAMVNVLSCADEGVRGSIVSGIARACEKFRVPMVGGHLHPDTSYTAIDVAILGSTDPNHLVLSSKAAIGDSVLYAIDLEGEFTPGIPYSFDTTSRKTPEEVRRRLAAMHELAPALTAGKDISNPGAVGTLGMLLEASGRGGVVDLSAIPRPEGVDLLQWLLAYQGCGFVVTCAPERARHVQQGFAEAGFSCDVCGSVDGSGLLEVVHQGQHRVVFDFSSDTLGSRLPKEI